MSARLGTQAEYAFRSRIAPGQIVSVNPDAGTCTFQLLYSQEQHTCDLPVNISAQGLNSAWQRHMPQEKDYVEVAFDPVNRPFIVRHSLWTGPDSAGSYAKLATVAKNDPAGFGAIFRTLNRGEYDLRSSGGAGYYFNNVGHATISGGPTAIELDARRLESRGRANLWVRAGDGTSVRYGDVRRVLNPVTDFVESPVVANPTGAVVAKEWRAVVGGTPSVGVTVTLADLHAGDVRDDRGVVVVQSRSQLPLRARNTYYGASGTTAVLTVEVDAAGNVAVTQAATAALRGLDVSVTKAAVKSTVGDLGLTAQANVTLAGAGGVATDGVVLGSALSTYLTSQAFVLTALGPSSPIQVPLIAGVEYSETVKASV